MITGRDVREVARFLSQHQHEGCHRARVGRFYYAAFIDARAFAEGKLGFTRIGGPQDHGKVRKAIRNQAGDKKLAYNLDVLRKLRNQADYDELIAFGQVLAIAQQAEQLAQSISQRLRNHGEPGFY